MKNDIRLVVNVIVLILAISCNNNDDNKDSELLCDYSTIIDQDGFDLPSSAVYTILNAELSESCLEITFGSSGCDTESWEFELLSDYPLVVDDSGWANLSLKLINSEVCAAYFTKTYSFDISNLAAGLSNITFSLEGWGGMLQYPN